MRGFQRIQDQGKWSKNERDMSKTKFCRADEKGELENLHSEAKHEAPGAEIDGYDVFFKVLYFSPKSDRKPTCTLCKTS